MGFSVLRFWLFFRSVFGFGVHCGLRIFHFLASGFRFLVKNTSGFSVLLSDVLFGFFLFCPIWVPVFLRFERQLISNSVLFIY